MARPVTLGGTFRFLGEVDGVASEPETLQASKSENWYLFRKKLVRRKGQAQIGAGTLTPDIDLQLLKWVRIGTTGGVNANGEHLIGVHNGDIVDFFGVNGVGSVVPNGVCRLCTALPDVNGAWLTNRFYLGSGVDQNVRYNGLEDKDPGAALFTAANSQYLSRATDANMSVGDVDFTLAGWVWFNSFPADAPIAGKWDRVTLSLDGYALHYNTSTGKFRFAIVDPFLSAVAAAETNNGTALVTGAWYFVVGWHDSVANTVNIQVNNGAVVSTATTHGATTETSEFRIGSLVNWLTFFDGRIESVGFWKSAASGGGVLSAGQRTSLYNGGSTKRFADLTAAEKVALIAYWNLDETAGSARVDSTGSGETLTDHATVGKILGNAASVVVAQVLPQDGGLSGSFAGVADSGVAGLPNGVYSYKFAFLSADGNAAQPSNATANVTVASKKITVSSIPTCPAGQECSGRRLYRTKAGGSTYFFLADISDNTTTTYTDNIADTALGAELTANLAGNTRFPPCRYLVEWENRMVGAHCETAEGDIQTVYISNVDQPWYCPASPDLEDPNQGTRGKLQGRSAGEITGLCPHGGVVVVFTGASGHLLQGVEPNDFRINKFCEHGCTAHRSIVSTRSLVIWLAPDAVYQWDGANTTRISDDVRETIEAISADDKSHANAFVWMDKYFLCWPTGCLVFDLEHRTWSANTNWLWRDTTVTVYVPAALQRIYAARTGHSSVYQLETGATDAIPAAGTAIPARWVSRDHDFGLIGRAKRIQWLLSYWRKSTGTATVQLCKGTGPSIQTVTVDLSAVGDIENTGDAGELEMRSMVGAVEQARSEFFRLDVQTSSTAASVELLGAGVMYSEVT